MVVGNTNGSGDTPSGNLAVQLTGDGVDTRKMKAFIIYIDILIPRHTSNDHCTTIYKTNQISSTYPSMTNHSQPFKLSTINKNNNNLTTPK